MEIAVEAWNMMGGLNWQALPIVAEIFGITDMETFIAQLITIRNWKRDNTGDD